MSISVLFNGIVYSIPETGEESWGENLTTYFTAIPQGALQKTGGNFTLTADANFGASFGLLASKFSTRASNASTAGVVRLAVSDSIGWRNNANNANLLLAINGSNQLTFNGSAIYPGGITALTGNVVATGPGSVVATIQAGVIVNSMISASAAIDFSKLAAVTSGNILVGDVSNVAASVAVSGDITISNAGVTAIGNNKVTNALLAQVSTQTFKGRTTASTGNVEDLTVTQATALLNSFVGDSGSGGTKGLVPAPASGDAAASKYLKANGLWDIPTGSGTVTNVALTTPNGLSVSGSPVTTTGTFALSNRAISAKTSNYTLTATDSVVTFDVSGGAATATLPTAVGINGTIYTIKKIDSSFTGVTLNTTSSQTIDGNASGTLILGTQNESIQLISDNSNWLILNHKTNTNMVSYTPTFNGFGTPSQISFWWRRVGDCMEVMGRFVSGVPTGAEARFNIPSGVSINTTKLPALRPVGRWDRSTANNDSRDLFADPSNPTNIYFAGANTGAFTAGGADSFVLNTDNVAVYATSVPIDGWFA